MWELFLTQFWFKHVEQRDTFFCDIFISPDLQGEPDFKKKHKIKQLNKTEKSCLHKQSHIPLEDSRWQQSTRSKHFVSINVKSLGTVALDQDATVLLLLHDGDFCTLVHFIFTRS